MSDNGKGMNKAAAAKTEEGQAACYTENELARAERYYRARAKGYFAKRAAFFAERMGVSYDNITIRSQKTRWGSRSSSGTLSFNWRLMLAPKEVLDYVVVHELAHIRQMNHSPAFWQEVAEVMPDYKKHRRWLKEHGTELTRAEAVRRIYAEK